MVHLSYLTAFASSSINFAYFSSKEITLRSFPPWTSKWLADDIINFDWSDITGFNTPNGGSDHIFFTSVPCDDGRLLCFSSFGKGTPQHGRFISTYTTNAGIFIWANYFWNMRLRTKLVTEIAFELAMPLRSTNLLRYFSATKEETPQHTNNPNRRIGIIHNNHMGPWSIISPYTIFPAGESHHKNCNNRIHT